MQSNVDSILAAGEGLGFAVRTAEPFEKDSYPALVVQGRTAQRPGINENARLYLYDWSYEVFVIARHSESTWEELETLTFAYMEKLTRSQKFRLGDLSQYEATIAGRAVRIFQFYAQAKQKLAL